MALLIVVGVLGRSGLVLVRWLLLLRRLRLFLVVWFLVVRAVRVVRLAVRVSKATSILASTTLHATPKRRGDIGSPIALQQPSAYRGRTGYPATYLRSVGLDDLVINACDHIGISIEELFRSRGGRYLGRSQHRRCCIGFRVASRPLCREEDFWSGRYRWLPCEQGECFISSLGSLVAGA